MSGRYLLIDARRKRALKNVAGSRFRLPRAEDPKVAKREVELLTEALPGDKWLPIRRSLGNWIMRAVLPDNLPDGAPWEVEDLWEVGEMFNGKWPARPRSMRRKAAPRAALPDWWIWLACASVALRRTR